MSFLLHVDHAPSEGIHGLLEVLLESFVDTLKIIPFLFITYLIMELIEHRASDKTLSLLKKSGTAGPLVGGLLGAAPQCAFSAVAANLYTGRVISLGTLLAVFLSTSDEMLPIMISESVGVGPIFAILGYKVAVGIFVGFTVDVIIRLTRRPRREIDIDQVCEVDNCHCERGVLYSALHHTATITLLIFIVTLLLGTAIHFIGAEALGEIVSKIPVVSHLVAAIIGLIPGCAVSVALTTLGLRGIISAGTMMAGLFSSSGVGIIILTRLNKSVRENLFIFAILVGISFVFGLLADLLNFSLLFA